MMSPKIVLRALLIAFATGCSKAPDPESARDLLILEGVRLAKEAADDRNPPTRREKLQNARALIEPLAEGDRRARQLYFDLVEMTIDLEFVEGHEAEAEALRGRFHAEMDAALESDPSDGALRGRRAYLHGLSGDDESAWKVVEAGIASTAADPNVEDALINFAACLPALFEAKGDRSQAEPGYERLVNLVRVFLARARTRGDPVERVSRLIHHEGSLLVRMGRSEEARASLRELERLDPASLEAFKLERLIETQ